MFRRYERLILHYPTWNRVNCKARKYTERQIIVRESRDLLFQPLTPAEYLHRPFVHRGRWLIRGFDVQFRAFRQFYLAGSSEHFQFAPLRVALYNPMLKNAEPIEPISRPFYPTPRERILLARCVARWQDYDFGRLVPRVTADEFEIIDNGGTHEPAAIIQRVVIPFQRRRCA